MNKWGHRTTTVGMAFIASGSLAFTAVAVMASTLPDRIEMGVFAHRGNSHSPICWGMFGATAVALLGRCDSSTPIFYALAVLFGVMSHLFMDMTSKAGIPVFPGLYRENIAKEGERVRWVYPRGVLRIGSFGGKKVDDKRDLVFGFMLICIAVTFGACSYVGIWKNPAQVNVRAVSAGVFAASNKYVWKMELNGTSHKEESGGAVPVKKKKEPYRS